MEIQNIKPNESKIPIDKEVIINKDNKTLKVIFKYRYPKKKILN